jgi:hypothetical protein
MSPENSAFYYTDYTQEFVNKNGDISYSFIGRYPTTINDFDKKNKPIIGINVNGRLLPSEKNYIIDFVFPFETDVPQFVLDPEFLNV